MRRPGKLFLCSLTTSSVVVGTGGRVKAWDVPVEMLETKR